MGKKPYLIDNYVPKLYNFCQLMSVSPLKVSKTVIYSSY